MLFGCQAKKPTEAPPDIELKPAVAALTKTGYQPGDSVTIQLSQPLHQLSVFWDGAVLLMKTVATDSIRIVATGNTVGRHQLVVQGLSANKERRADTLSVDLWSDVTPQKLTYALLQTYPHQTSSFTQGLEFDQGTLYEGTGLNGQSKLMKVDLKTGTIQQSVSLPEQHFGEGITVVGNHVYQLTWTSGQCFRYTKDLVQDNSFAYHTQGWGLTHRDTTLIMSDGSNRLVFYTPTLQRTGELAVYDNNGPVVNLNELEYVNGYVLANVWQTNRIVQIDLATGKVVGELVMDAILPAGVNTRENVLNGIAYRLEEGALYVTGKNWPSLFKLKVNGLQKARKGATIQ
ncbi:glutaminyl-peptide cyclotransferase [Fibrella sp. HMF5405]|uniref:Glutaminyl-peptide cyclotransferase n=2 Tax=Fibrella forsythiae TaxID=2817061 RepID=A0ABS3JJA7_9BACT|nr:glutaminyl-peptide cyclotransferase [Fibrella forsythiae]